MPLTDVQERILRILAAHRSPDSYVAGATVLHRDPRSPRYSQDLDLFHDLEESVALCAEADAAALTEAGCAVEWVLKSPAFRRAVATLDGRTMKIEWAQDSAFRFFPVVKDERCGYRLHEADAEVNKILALAGRQEARDLVDAVHLHETRLHLGALAWAACGKDPGFTPDFLLDQAARHVAYRQEDLDRLQLAHPLDVRDLKTRWLAALESAQSLVARLPPAEVGSLYLDVSGDPVTPDPDAKGFQALHRHVGRVRGAWPVVG